MRHGHENESVHADSDRITERTYEQRLQQNHADDPAVGRAGGLQHAELFEVFQREHVESLACNDRPNDDGDHDRNAEHRGESRVADVIPDRHPSELVAAKRLKAGLIVDTFSHVAQPSPWGTLRKDEREKLSLSPDKIERKAIAGVEDGQRPERH